MLHVVTRKGKGFEVAEADPITWHGASRFDRSDPAAAGKGHSWSDAFGAAVTELARWDDRVWAITPAMREGSGLVGYSKAFPHRYLDVGIAEDVAVTTAAGLALRGEKPVVAIYSTFLQRAVDQVIHDVAIEDLDVVFAIDRAGLVGGDGMTHQGVYDLAFLRSVPNLSVAMPVDVPELRSMLKGAIRRGGPVAVRWPRGTVRPVADAPAEAWDEIEWGSWSLLKPGTEVAVLALGPTVAYALEAAGTDPGIAVVNARFVKPLDATMLLGLVDDGLSLVTVEDHALAGGMGSAVLEALADAGRQVAVRRLGIADVHVPHGESADQHASLGYGPDGIRRAVAELRGGGRMASHAVDSGEAASV